MSHEFLTWPESVPLKTQKDIARDFVSIESEIVQTEFGQGHVVQDYTNTRSKWYSFLVVQ